MEDGRYVDGSVSFYAPNKGAPVFFAVAFLVSGVVRLWQTRHYKCWRLTGLYVICFILFVAGFITRAPGAFDYTDLMKYIVSICLVYAARPIYELANYYILGRILYFVPSYSPIHPGRVLTTFAAISMVIEALNGNGASYIANQSLSENKRNIGEALLKAALLMQIIVVVLFIALASYFQLKCRHNGVNSQKLNRVLTTLYTSTALITIPRPGYKQERNFFVTLFDPFDIYGKVKARDKQTRFRDEDDGVGQGNASANSAKRSGGETSTV